MAKLTHHSSKKSKKSSKIGNEAMNATINKKLTKTAKENLLRKMLQIRRFEQAALKYYNQGHMGGFLHLYIGQESVVAGTLSLLGKEDHSITAYREHGHALFSGMDIKACMSELFGKKTGASKGKGGSMHLFSPEKRFWGGHGIVGGQVPLGLGIAYALKYKETKGVCLCYMGDGAVNQGAVHESFNLAALFELPIVFIIENNQYSMGTSQNRSSAYKDCLARRAEAYDMAWEQFDGHCLYTVRKNAEKAIKRAKQKSLPTILEISTYRYYGHSIADANAKKYRNPQEIELYKKNYDPITLWQNQLIEEKIINEEKYQAIDREIKEEIKEAVEFAIQSPDPNLEEIFDDIYWEVDNQTSAGQSGRHFFND